MPDIEYFELNNGIKLIHKQDTNTKIAHCAVMLDIGSRDELPQQQGLAHFWEHMVFKGTEKRKAFHIINRLESLGGELNAYTTKEKICFYASLLDEHIDKSLELLSDITFNSTFPEKEIDKERNVILEEMSLYQDSPEDAIQDELDLLVYEGHQLGNNILGTKNSVSNFKKTDFDQFIDQNMDTSRIVISTLGNFSLAEITRKVNKYFSKVPIKQSLRERKKIEYYQVSNRTEKKDLAQLHVGMGCQSFDIHSDQKIPFFVLNNILGSHNMTSRLNLSLREKHGLVYHIDSNFQGFTDTGLFSIFYATDPKNIDRSIALIEKEFKLLRSKPLGIKQLQTAKAQIKGQLAMSEENNQNFMLMMAKSHLDYGGVESLASVFHKIDQINANQLMALANETLDLSKMCMLRYTAN